MKNCLLAALFLVSPLAEAEIEFHGFTIDDRLLSAEQKANFTALAAPALFAQLAIVESVGLQAPVLELFKKTPILIDPDLRGNPAFSRYATARAA